jgi:hypothetical protein
MSILPYIVNLAHHYRKAYYALGKLEYAERCFDMNQIKAARRRNNRARRRR